MHHTGIKTLLNLSSKLRDIAFQLHHTGIKTSTLFDFLELFELFQLHHTGIKTIRREDGIRELLDFNCTIQELKLPWSCPNRFFSSTYFNCTIQELKRSFDFSSCLNTSKFQLHHTGIKTSWGFVFVYASIVISIAPYRN